MYHKAAIKGNLTEQELKTFRPSAKKANEILSL